MEKKKLSLNELEVKSFTTGPIKVKGGTGATNVPGCTANPLLCALTDTYYPELCTFAQVCL